MSFDPLWPLFILKLYYITSLGSIQRLLIGTHTIALFSGDSGSEWESNSEQDPVELGESPSPNVTPPSVPLPVEIITTAARVEEDSPWDRLAIINYEGGHAWA